MSKISQNLFVAKWIARPLDMRDVRGSGPSLVRVDSEDPLRGSNRTRR